MGKHIYKTCYSNTYILICFTSWYEHENTEQIHTNLMHCNKWMSVLTVIILVSYGYQMVSIHYKVSFDYVHF